LRQKKKPLTYFKIGYVSASSIKTAQNILMLLWLCYFDATL